MAALMNVLEKVLCKEFVQMREDENKYFLSKYFLLLYYVLNVCLNFFKVKGAAVVKSSICTSFHCRLKITPFYEVEQWRLCVCVGGGGEGCHTV